MTCKIDYTANGDNVAFPFPFAIPAKSALEVRVNDAIRDVGFRINTGSADGGVVLFDSAPASGEVISLRYLGAVTIGVNDVAAGHLADKLVAGDGISLSTETEDGGIQRLRIAVIDMGDFLEKTANLSDVADKAVARINLGVYSKAEADAADQSVRDAALLKVNNLSDLADKPAARENLGLGSAATYTVGVEPGQIPTIDQIPTVVPGVPAGTVIYVASSTVPAGYLRANGDAVSRTAYAGLFAVIGTTFGAGDGATTFKLPDLRGEFVRGWDNGRGVDSGRVLGTLQSQQVAAHKHVQGSGFQLTGQFGSTSGAYDSPTGTTLYPLPFTNDGSDFGGMTNSGVIGAETRPRNVALLACIKF